ncbi:MAG: thioredoxin domain-containing protein [Burkholderiales bacterium]
MNDTSPLLVACLCAQWCGTCRDYVATFEAAAPAFGAAIRWRWIDIEDEAALLDGADVENFPTLPIARGDRVLFFGPLTPQPQTIARLLTGALAGELPRVAPDPEVDALVRRLNATRLGA